MAKRFFNQKVKNSNKSTTLVIVSIVAFLLAIVIAVLISMNLNNHKDAVIKLRDSVAIEVNTDYPDKTTFFAELENVKEKDIKVDYKDIDLKNVGKYDIVLKVYGKKYKSTLEIVDTEAPELTLKDVTIPSNGSYSAQDFVSECNDNSGKTCKVMFYALGVNQNGDKIDYSGYKNDGAYRIQIIASDEAGNVTSPIDATLIIGDKTSNPTTCNYGNANYDSEKYTLSLNLTDGSCAIDPNLYNSETNVNAVNERVNAQQEKIKKEFSKINLNTKDVHIDSKSDPILNLSGDGLVGYSIYMEVYIEKNGTKDIIESFYVNSDGSRKYIINKYLK